MTTPIDVEKKSFFEANSKRFVYQEHLKKGCAECGERGKRWLQFHHRNPYDKLFEIGSGLSRKSITRQIFDLELEKCDVLCIACHKRKHANKSLQGPPYAYRKRSRMLDKLRNNLRKNEHSRSD